MSTIKAIETRYAGCRFRSRLEARWAVFFDHLRIPWEYEPQGFELPSGPYLPDFWLPDTEVWVEIKGHKPTKRDTSKLIDLAYEVSKSGYRCRMLAGDVPRHSVDLAPLGAAVNALVPRPEYLLIADHSGTTYVEIKDGHPTFKMEDYHRTPVEYWGLTKTAWVPGYEKSELDEAFTAARSARFEHGEQG